MAVNSYLIVLQEFIMKSFLSSKLIIELSARIFIFSQVELMNLVWVSIISNPINVAIYK